MIEVLVFLAITVIVVLIVRLFGAWMLRIDEVISNQKRTIDIMNRLNHNIEKAYDLKNTEIRSEPTIIDKDKEDLIRDLENKLLKKEITPSEFQTAKSNIMNL